MKNDQQRHVKNEIAIMRQIRHPHIVNMQDVFFSEHNLYLVLELAPGGEAPNLNPFLGRVVILNIQENES